MREFKPIADLLRAINSRTPNPNPNPNPKSKTSKTRQPADRPAPPIDQARLLRVWDKELSLGAAHLHSWPLLFTSGRLVVFVESAVWGTEIRNQSQQLIKTLAQHGITTHNIQVKIQPNQKTQQPQQHPQPPPPLPPYPPKTPPASWS